MLANVPTPGRDFSALQRYLIDGHTGRPDPDRVTFVAARNLLSDDPDLAARIMRATAAQSARVERPVYHLIISWHPAERPNSDTMLQVLGATLEDIGLAEHQALVVGHGDTENPHLHAMINRVHPDTGVAWSTSHDYRRIERSMRRQAEANGFMFVPGRHNQPEKAAARPRQASRREHSMLRKRDLKPLPQWPLDKTRELGRRLRPAVEKARDWKEFAAAIEAFGGHVVAKGQGLVITDRHRSGYAKFSSLGTGLRAKDLTQRFGCSFADWSMAQKTAPMAPHTTPGRPLFTVTEMDVVLGLYRIGLADRSNVEAVAEERDRRRSDAPPTLERQMREALRTATRRPTQRRAKQTVTSSPEPSHEPQP